MLLDNYTSPWMDEELHIMRGAVAKFLEKEFVPHMEKWEKQGYLDRDAWLKAGEAGLLCASIPSQYGGGGGNFKHEMVLVEELSYANITGFGNGVHSGIVAHYINSYGTQEQKEKWLPKMANGEIVSAIAMTEPGTGSDLQSVKTTAVRDGEHYTLNGQKTFLTNGMSANLICVVAKTDPSEAAKGISLIVVETETVEGEGGFSRGRNLEKLGLKAQDTAEIFFDNTKVPVDNLLGTVEGKGFVQLMEQLPQERLIIAAGACAAIEKALRLTSEYVKERKAFGKRILDFQNTQFKLAERFTEAKLARVFVDDCAVKLAEGKLDSATAAMAKWWTTQKQNEIVDECLQFFGGYGYMMEYPIARMYADSRIQKIYGGSNEIMKLLIAREI
ncbi:MAG: acyl-CoA dehydrogenase [Gammaproteobacteria bacterium]|jgi:acyl-CoA dehydrogenase|nr:acyl-CoA dehydrogenase [Gammaproteobacteria bacterium]MCH2576847.1 acyl-CoA dehydrogenase family protein [Pseudomonadales bacterium]MEC7767198.1 acyl-CoA dehydrogenase family protein [Pseudomonadota bacterium]MEC8949619.1 acyl-CoA dehydrogenase family protein [Pseudomonadota bacterium]MEC9218115.1 acyl-CoA dehydrogenase family protein [Pseudomonadota bacterium]|tara:strand:- start:887 stop:2050 length:1164 start_codon:yes stop_codon:yes gene_type:complete